MKERISKHINFIYTLLIAVALFGCRPQPKGGSIESIETKYGDFTIKVIDSCEYIEYDDGIVDQRVYSLTHKGNCKFCIKRNN
jgi:hypothetical protein